MEITVQEHVSCSEESMHIMLQKAFLEPSISAPETVHHGCPTSINIFSARVHLRQEVRHIASDLQRRYYWFLGGAVDSHHSY